MDELPEATRNRILLEESYRAEVQEQIKKREGQKVSHTSRLIRFLNTSFGLWLLSAIFITGAGSLYTQWRIAHEERQKKEAGLRTEAKKMAEVRGRLRLEIGHRISQTVVLLWNLSDRKDPSRLGAGHSVAEVEALLATFQSGGGQKLGSLYPEFENQNTLALMTELRRIEDTKQSMDVLDQSVADLSGLNVLLDVAKAPLSNPQKVAGALLKRFSAILWGNFYFLDCSPEAPFC